MQAIWKFPLVITDEQTVAMPRGSAIMCVQNQKQGEDETLCLWARVDINAPPEPRRILIYGTGHQHDEIEGIYIGTAQQFGGRGVWHVFEG